MTWCRLLRSFQTPRHEIVKDVDVSDNDDVIEQLRAVSEVLSDRAIGLLREAVDNGDEEAIAAEKRITRARRAVEKAIHLLRSNAD